MASTYTVERSRLVDAPAERVYLLIANFQQWTRWSPWEDVDPEMERRYSGPDIGVGAVYSWAGNRKAGSGRMEVVRVEEDREVEIALDFEKPFRSSNVTTFLLAPQGEDRTHVTWRMVGPRPLPLRILSPIVNMDKIVGKDFERGLERLGEAARPTPAG